MFHQYATAKQIVISLAMCLWLPRLNVRKKVDPKTNLTTDDPAVLDPKDPKTKELIESFRDRGYDPQYPVIVGDISEEYVKEGMALLQNEYAGLQAMCRTTPSDDNMAELAAFEFFYLVPHGKKAEKIIATPKYLGCTGNRRSQCIRRAAVLRLVAAHKDDPNAYNTPEKYLEGLTLAALHEVFADDVARTMRQIAENTAKTEGFKQLSYMENLLAIKQGVEVGRIKQSDLREQFKDGEGQRMFGFLTLNSRFPKLKLFDKLRLPESNPDAIIWSRLPQGGAGGFPSVIRQSNPHTLEESNAKLIAAGKKPEDFLSEDDVWGKFVEWRTGKKNVTKMMDKSKIQQLQSVNPVKFINDMMGDVLGNKVENIEKITAISPTLNAVHGLLGKPEFNGVSEIVTKVAAITDDAVRADFVAYLDKASKGYEEPKTRERVVKALS